MGLTDGFLGGLICRELPARPLRSLEPRVKAVVPDVLLGLSDNIFAIGNVSVFFFIAAPNSAIRSANGDALTTELLIVCDGILPCVIASVYTSLNTMVYNRFSYKSGNKKKEKATVYYSVGEKDYIWFIKHPGTEFILVFI